MIPPQKAVSYADSHGGPCSPAAAPAVFVAAIDGLRTDTPYHTFNSPRNDLVECMSVPRCKLAHTWQAWMPADP